jgi:hypothetical protein
MIGLDGAKAKKKLPPWGKKLTEAWRPRADASEKTVFQWIAHRKKLGWCTCEWCVGVW